MMTIYRLEYMDGGGVYFDNNGFARYNQSLSFNEDLNMLYAYKDRDDFRNNSIYEYYLKDDCILYKIIVTEIVYASKRTNEVVFDKRKIVTKIRCEK